MEVGETVVLVGNVDGTPAGKEGLVMRVRGDMLLIGIRSVEIWEFDMDTKRLGPAQTSRLCSASGRLPGFHPA